MTVVATMRQLEHSLCLSGPPSIGSLFNSRCCSVVIGPWFQLWLGLGLGVQVGRKLLELGLR